MAANWLDALRAGVAQVVSAVYGRTDARYDSLLRLRIDENTSCVIDLDTRAVAILPTLDLSADPWEPTTEVSLNDAAVAADALLGHLLAEGGTVDLAAKKEKSDDDEEKPPLGTGERFERLRNKLEDRGADDPDALAAWIGREKYGAKRFAKLGARGRAKNASDDPRGAIHAGAMAALLLAVQGEVDLMAAGK